MEDHEGFEIVQRKTRNVSPVTQECMILTENEIREQSNRLNCRKGTTTSMENLFRVEKDRPVFPKAFENYRPQADAKKETPFTRIGQRNVVRNKIEAVDSSGTIQ
jgi:hypothetical protein